MITKSSSFLNIIKKTLSKQLLKYKLDKSKKIDFIVDNQFQGFLKYIVSNKKYISTKNRIYADYNCKANFKSFYKNITLFNKKYINIYKFYYLFGKGSQRKI